MTEIQEQLERWRRSRCEELSVDGLLSRCPVAHKWKAPYRSCVIREALLWRMHDLAQQTLLLSREGHILGARILLRSAIETLAVLIYLNQRTKAVLGGDMSFFAFDTLTKQLMIGSKNGVTSLSAVNILTVLSHAEKAHPGLESMHRELSESAHPNFDGVVLGYSATDPERYETHFVNNWVKFFGNQQEPGTCLVMAAFEFEYDVVWPDCMASLEQWLRDHDSRLEQEQSTPEEG